MRTIPALILASACLLSGCASPTPIALRLDRDGTPILHNKSGKELHDVQIRVVAGALDGRTAIDDISIQTWSVDGWQPVPGAQLDRVAAMEARGESKEVKNFRIKWTVPYLP